MIRELAENANTYTPVAPDEERVANERYVISFGASATAVPLVAIPAREDAA